MGQSSDDPAFWEAMEPALCASSRLALAESDVAAILAGIGVRSKASVLDLGCGPGAHAVAFARLGYRVTGVDTLGRLLGHARSRARAAGVEVEWLQAEMRRFQRPQGFAIACSLYASFGYFDDDVNRAVLENVRASLAPGGVFVLDLVGREVATRRRQERRSQEIDGDLYRGRCKLSDDASFALSDSTVVRNARAPSSASSCASIVALSCKIFCAARLVAIARLPKPRRVSAA